VLDLTEDGIVCSCEAGRHGRECLHAAALRYCLAHSIMGAYVECAGQCGRRVPGGKANSTCDGCQEREATMRENAAILTATDCRHVWEGRDGGSEYRCATCGTWRSYADPVHERQTALTSARMGANVVPFARPIAPAGVDPLADLWG
jgi:hypothetical protein